MSRHVRPVRDMEISMSDKPRLFLLGGDGKLPTDEEIAAVVRAIRGGAPSTENAAPARATSATDTSTVMPEYEHPRSRRSNTR